MWVVTHLQYSYQSMISKKITGIIYKGLIFLRYYIASELYRNQKKDRFVWQCQHGTFVQIQWFLLENSCFSFNFYQGCFCFCWRILCVLRGCWGCCIHGCFFMRCWVFQSQTKLFDRISVPKHKKIFKAISDSVSSFGHHAGWSLDLWCCWYVDFVDFVLLHLFVSTRAGVCAVPRYCTFYFTKILMENIEFLG